MQRPFSVEVWLTEQQIAAEFESAFTHRFLDEKFFYWLPPSVQAWVDLTTSTEYRNSNRALQVLKAEAGRVVELWPDAGSLCSLGCGEGSKDRVILEAFAEHGKLLDYVATDFSQALLELAIANAVSVSGAQRGVKFDVFSDRQFGTLKQSGRPCIFAILGNTLGAFDPQKFPSRLRRLMRAEDRALFDGEIFAGESTLRGYDNPTNRRFAFGPLTAMGVTEEDGELMFEVRTGQNGLHEVAKYFEARRDIVVRFAGKVLKLSAGERVLMSSSVKYDEEAFYGFIRQGEFEIEHSAKSKDGHFMLAAVRAA